MPGSGSEGAIELCGGRLFALFYPRKDDRRST